MIACKHRVHGDVAGDVDAVKGMGDRVAGELAAGLLDRLQLGQDARRGIAGGVVHPVGQQVAGPEHVQAARVAGGHAEIDREHRAGVDQVRAAVRRQQVAVLVEGDAARGQGRNHGRDAEVAEAGAEDLQLAVDRLAGHLLADQARAGFLDQEIQDRRIVGEVLEGVDQLHGRRADADRSDVLGGCPVAAHGRGLPGAGHAEIFAAVAFGRAVGREEAGRKNVFGHAVDDIDHAADEITTGKDFLESGSGHDCLFLR